MERNFSLTIIIIGFTVLTVASFIFSLIPVVGPAFLAFFVSRLFWETRVAILEFLLAAVLGNLLMAWCISAGLGENYFWIEFLMNATSSILGMAAGIIKEKRDLKKSVTT